MFDTWLYDEYDLLITNRLNSPRHFHASPIPKFPYLSRQTQRVNPTIVVGASSARRRQGEREGIGACRERELNYWVTLLARMWNQWPPGRHLQWLWGHSSYEQLPTTEWGLNYWLISQIRILSRRSDRTRRRASHTVGRLFTIQLFYCCNTNSTTKRTSNRQRILFGPFIKPMRHHNCTGWISLQFQRDTEKSMETTTVNPCFNRITWDQDRNELQSTITTHNNKT